MHVFRHLQRIASSQAFTYYNIILFKGTVLREFDGLFCVHLIVSMFLYFRIIQIFFFFELAFLATKASEI
jgi:hypothetical protein